MLSKALQQQLKTNTYKKVTKGLDYDEPPRLLNVTVRDHANGRCNPRCQDSHTTKSATKLLPTPTPLSVDILVGNNQLRHKPLHLVKLRVVRLMGAVQGLGRIPNHHSFGYNKVMVSNCINLHHPLVAVCSTCNKTPPSKTGNYILQWYNSFVPTIKF